MQENIAHPEVTHDEHVTMSRGKIWKVFFILLLITVIEFILALWVYPHGYISRLPLNVIYIVLTLLKAFYIVSYFMHLKFEKQGLKVVMGVALIFIIYFIILLLVEGGFLSKHMLFT